MALDQQVIQLKNLMMKNLTLISDQTTPPSLATTSSEALAQYDAARIDNTAATTQGALKLIVHALGMPVSYLTCIASSQDRLQVVAAFSTIEQMGPAPGTVLELDNTFCGFVALSKHQILVEDTTTDTRFSTHPAHRNYPGVRSYVGLPVVLNNGSVYGTLCAVSDEPTNVTVGQTMVMNIIAGLIAARIEEDVEVANLHREHRFSNAITDTAGSLIVVLDSEGRFVRFNRACEEISGYYFAEVKGRPFWDIFLNPAEAPEVMALFAALRAGHFPNQHENDWVMKDGHARTIAWSNTALLDDNGLVQYIVGTGIDVTEQRTAEAKLHDSEQMLELIYNNMTTAISVIDDRGCFVKVNHACEQLFGWSEAELVGQPINMVAMMEGEGAITPNYEQQFEGKAGEITNTEFKCLRKDGRVIEVSMANAHLLRGDGRIFSVGALSDITERRRQEHHLIHLSHHDHLTGLPNRRAMEEKLIEVVATSSIVQESALLFIDLDGFKKINDTSRLGHAAGDQALLTVAETLMRSLRADDLLARVGGDEFAVLLPRTPLTVAMQRAEQLRAAVAAEPFILDGCSYPLSLSIGLVAIAGQVAAHTVLTEADTAMYLAKRQGGNRVITFGAPL